MAGSTMKLSSMVVKTKTISICLAITLLLPVSIGGTTVALLAYCFHIVGVGLGVMLMVAALLINIYTCYLVL